VSYSVLNLKADLEGVLHGTTVNQIQNIDGVINRAARQLLLDLDPQETKRQVEFVNPIFNSVYEYPIAADVKGNKIIDIYPQVQRIPQDIWLQSYNQAFDVAKQNIFSMQNMFTINFNTSLKTLRINAPFLNPPTVINQIEAITTNGTWYLSGDASNLTVNNSNFAQGSGSLQFDVDAGVAAINNSTTTAVDLSAVENQSSLFLWVYFPSASDVTSVALQWGSNPNLGNDYYQRTVTTTQQGTVFQNGWNLLQFQWAGSSVTGTPDSSAINSVVVYFNTTGSQTGCLINGLNSILGTVLSYEYYSKYLFRSASTGAYQETVLDDSDLINLDTESYNLLFNQVAYLAAQQQQGVDALRYDGGFFKNAYDAGVIRYKGMYKSELQKPQSVYYQKPDTSYNQIIGRNW
jgi:hypothetical protein